MSQPPAALHYAKSHESVRLESDGTATIGITDYAQNSLGDITYVQVPKVGANLRAGETFAAVESVKAASDLYAPITGTVIAVNGSLERSPETVNSSPYGDGWVVKLQPVAGSSLEGLLDAEGYGRLTG